MLFSRSLAAAVAGVAALIQSCQGHSTQRSPIDYLTIVEDPVLISPAHLVHSESKFDLTFLIHSRSQKVKLSLEPNKDVIPDTIHVRYLNSDGTSVDGEPIKRRDHKVFKGTAYVQRPGRSGWSRVGWARISIFKDGEEPVFAGGFQIDGDNHHILTGKKYRQTKLEADPEVEIDKDEDSYMVVYRDSDSARRYTGHDDLKRRGELGGTACSSDALSFNSDFRLKARSSANLEAMSLRWLFGRQIDGPPGDNGAGVNLVDNIGSKAGCPTTRKVALMGVATDCTYTNSFDSESELRRNIIDQVNLASEVYERTFDISLGIRNLTISSPDCPAQTDPEAPWNLPCSGSTTIVDRLNLFSAWRGEQGDDNAFWTLMSLCNTQSAVGLAWLGQVCVTSALPRGTSGETVSGANVVVRTDKEWQVIAHEIGHTFGAVHDCLADACQRGEDDDQRCCPLSRSTCNAGGEFIMNPATNDGITDFSQCSIGNICSAMNTGSVRTDCLLDNRNVITIQESQCGNGIVEEGEECDCGGDSCGDNACCDAQTCQFIGDAVCDPSNSECCTQQCQLAARGAVCRESTGPCDPEETCSGEEPMCPRNQHARDGDSCGDDLTCASGICTSRDLQCQQRLSPNGNDTSITACEDDSGCQLCCQQDGGAERLPPGSFIDGTSCRAGGTCQNGRCAGSNIGSEVAAWFEENKRIVIPVAATLGGLLVIAIGFCCISCIWRRIRLAKMKRRARGKGTPSPMGSWSSYGGAWGSGSPGHVPAPPPRAARPPAQQQYDFPNEWRPQRRTTMRYA